MSSTSKDGILAVCGSLIGLSTIAVGLRFYARKYQQQSLKADDWLVIPAWASYLGASICIFLLVHHHEFGYPESTTALSKDSDLTQIALDILSNTTLACTKLSALFFYRRIFLTGVRNAAEKWFNVLSMVTIVIVILWYVAFQFLVGFQCGTHFTALWTADYTKYCTISEPFLYGLAVSDFILEVWILVLPIPSILRLQISARKKISIFGIFLLAFIGLGASIARMVAYIEIDLSNGAYLQVHKFELVLTQVFYLTMLEAGMTLVAVNLPSLWILRTSAATTGVLNGVRSVLSLVSNGSGSLRSNSATRQADQSKDIHLERVTTITHEVAAPKSAYASRGDVESGVPPVPALPQKRSEAWEST